MYRDADTKDKAGDFEHSIDLSDGIFVVISINPNTRTKFQLDCLQFPSSSYSNRIKFNPFQRK